MKTDMQLDVTPAVFATPLKLFKTEEILAHQCMQAVDGVADVALDDVAVEQGQVV